MGLSIGLEKRSVVTILFTIEVWTSRNSNCFFEKRTCMHGWIVFANSWKRLNVSHHVSRDSTHRQHNGSMRRAIDALDPLIVSPTRYVDA